MQEENNPYHYFTDEKWTVKDGKLYDFSIRKNKWVKNNYYEWVEPVVRHNTKVVKDTLGADSLVLVYYDNGQLFYQIPYRKLINKIRDKFGEHLIEIGEAYTSKTDSLAKELIEKQENYLGERIKRGLFSSSKGKLINADLNGAINIMRLYMKKYEECDLEEIKGIHLYNPKAFIF